MNAKSGFRLCEDLRSLFYIGVHFRIFRPYGSVWAICRSHDASRSLSVGTARAGLDRARTDRRLELAMTRSGVFRPTTFLSDPRAPGALTSRRGHQPTDSRRFWSSSPCALPRQSYSRLTPGDADANALKASSGDEDAYIDTERDSDRPLAKEFDDRRLNFKEKVRDVPMRAIGGARGESEEGESEVEVMVNFIDDFLTTV